METLGLIAIDDLRRFWSKVDTSGECWLWTGALNNHGYGVCSIGGVLFYAHRVALYMTRPCPDQFDVIHSCDNPACVNPTHLRPGAHADNMLDMAVKGRSGMAKLTRSNVEEILTSNASSRALGRKFGVDKSTILRVRAGETWAYVA